ncbi:hypothetical protein SAMN04515656_1415 [Eubacterium aggregans]|uniref:Uncharacterized protein n=1 Tax=Eubacterium aggregans TaxID=81409 RepID=A0A1H4EFM3_9FIRM|nr:hypothetical protein [Eubacterium aggregans]SEA83855.1 hypothetical protein SAMN04515656_1415 [Eubacterium aggregans]
MDNHGEMLIYQTVDGPTKIDVNIQEETVWRKKENKSSKTINLNLWGYGNG